MMNVTICTPLAISNDPLRQRNWDIVYNELIDTITAFDIPWIVAEHGGTQADRPGITRIDVPENFTRSRARNIAYRAAKTTHLIFLDADVVMSSRTWRTTIRDCTDYDLYSPSLGFYSLGPKKTQNRIHDGRYQFDIPIHLDANHKALAALICAVRTKTLDELGGWDERFTGWGHEDSALGRLIVGGGYQIGIGNDSIIHLYHRPSPGKRTQAKATKRLRRSAYKSPLSNSFPPRSLPVPPPFRHHP